MKIAARKMTEIESGERGSSLIPAAVKMPVSERPSPGFFLRRQVPQQRYGQPGGRAPHQDARNPRAPAAPAHTK